MTTFDELLPNSQAQLDAALTQWGGHRDLWLFGYASLIWKPEFSYAQRLDAHVHGWHRALCMWSRLYRGTPECPGLVFGLLSGGSCHGQAFRIPAAQSRAVLTQVWHREMVSDVYAPRWLTCRTTSGTVQALAFTLSRDNPQYTGTLSDAQYSEIFQHARGCYGSTLDYARQTHQALLAQGIDDKALSRLLTLTNTA
jgi:glutathione-specific gamma-glutamylcyclotransferase